MWSNDKNYPWRSRGFLTPQPPEWKKPPSHQGLPMSERKGNPPSMSKGDCFHAIHKVPASDSPYGRAKQVQLIDKDPSKAISLFWAAINAGDRVDSALKDMAVVMKQLNRCDEAIEAIKSFSHLCPCDSQQSLDNILAELYKRSGRVEEEIEMLQNKLRNIDEGAVFGGRRTKIARSQGKMIQITIEQEKSRILGNLAWAYLQQHNYGIAEKHYRQAMSLEPDRNKQCNLAICLMHMNRIDEAKSLLQDVKTSSGNEQMDEPYSKSYERALEMLLQVESTSKLEPGPEQEPDKGRALPRKDNNSGPIDWGKRPYAHWEGKSHLRNHLEENDNFSGCDDRSSNCIPIALKGNLWSSPRTTTTHTWRKDSYLDSPCEGSVYRSKVKENWGYTTGQASSAASKKNSEALFTQPRRCSWGFDSTDHKRGGTWREDKVRNSIRKLSFDQQALGSEGVPLHSIQKLNEEPHALSNGNSENSATGQVEEQQVQEEGLSGVLLTQPRKSSLWLNKKKERWAEDSVSSSPRKLSFGKTTTTVSSRSQQNLYDSPLISSKDESEIRLEKPADALNKKSWADMVEDEEKEELLTGKELVGKCYDGFNGEEKFNDENLNSNIVCQHPDTKEHVGNINKQLESFQMRNGHDAPANTISSRRNRLQVFQDITSQ